MYECRECYDDPDISAGKIKQFCKTCSTQVTRAHLVDVPCRSGQLLMVHSSSGREAFQSQSAFLINVAAHVSSAGVCVCVRERNS